MPAKKNDKLIGSGGVLRTTPLYDPDDITDSQPGGWLARSERTAP